MFKRSQDFMIKCEPRLKIQYDSNQGRTDTEYRYRYRDQISKYPILNWYSGSQHNSHRHRVYLDLSSFKSGAEKMIDQWNSFNHFRNRFLGFCFRTKSSIQDRKPTSVCLQRKWIFQKHDLREVISFKCRRCCNSCSLLESIRASNKYSL